MSPKILREIEYPTSDGKPMAETDRHLKAMVDAVQTLEDYFADEPRVYVAGNNFVYFTEGEPKDVVSPDVYVVRGVRKKERDCFKAWDEKGRLPCFVVEVTSKKTKLKDRGSKMARYCNDLRVPEYFLFDPRGDWVEERLRGFTLREVDGVTVYQPIKLRKGRLASAELGLELAVVDGRLRFFRPGEKAPLPTRAERAEEERQRAEEERRRADSAEAEVARLRRELARAKKRKR